jgi:hypothetical protein
MLFPVAVCTKNIALREFFVDLSGCQPAFNHVIRRDLFLSRITMMEVKSRQMRFTTAETRRSFLDGDNVPFCGTHRF